MGLSDILDDETLYLPRRYTYLGRKPLIEASSKPVLSKEAPCPAGLALPPSAPAVKPRPGESHAPNST